MYYPPVVFDSGILSTNKWMHQLWRPPRKIGREHDARPDKVSVRHWKHMTVKEIKTTIQSQPGGPNVLHVMR